MVLWDCNNQRDGSWQAAHPGHHTDSRPNASPPPSLSVKEAYLLVVELQPERQVSGWHTLGRYRGALRNVIWGTPSFPSLSASL